MIDRRHFLKLGATLLATSPLHPLAGQNLFAPSTIKPPRWKPGDVIGLVNPAGIIFTREDVDIVKEKVLELDLQVKEGDHLLDRYGYLAGQDEDRAADLMKMYADPDVDGLLALRGGWGCARILPMLDYRLIRKNPKILMGYSDITSLLLAIYARTGIVTFHGPVGTSTWNGFSTEYVKKMLFDAEAVVMRNPTDQEQEEDEPSNGILTITPGVSRGKILGGNLSVLSSMAGSAYLPDFRDAILFVEEIGEEPYRVDRMLTQLKIAGILDQLSGFVFGKCTRCEAETPNASLSLEQVLDDHIKPLGIPAWYGAMIGHITDKFTMPLGIRAEIDSTLGEIKLLEAAVS